MLGASTNPRAEDITDVSQGHHREGGLCVVSSGVWPLRSCTSGGRLAGRQDRDPGAPICQGSPLKRNNIPLPILKERSWCSWWKRFRRQWLRQMRLTRTQWGVRGGCVPTLPRLLPYHLSLPFSSVSFCLQWPGDWNFPWDYQCSPIFSSIK